MAEFKPALLKKRSLLRSGEPALASYDWTDIASGLGYVDFYLFTSRNDGTISYGVTTQILGSQNITTTQSVGGAAPGSSSLNWDSSALNSPRTIGKGDIILDFSASGGLGFSGRTYNFRAQVIKLTGAVETILGTGQSVNYTANLDKTNFVMALPITDIVNLKIGDIIRVKVTLEVTVGAGTSGTPTTLTYGTDPKDRDGTVELPNQFKISVPFRIEV